MKKAGKAKIAEDEAEEKEEGGEDEMIEEDV